jgi:hypothetical protein
MLAGLSAQQQQRGEEEHDDDEDEWDDDGGWGQPEHVKARGTHRHAATTCIHLYAAGYAVVESLLQPCCSVRLCRGAVPPADRHPGTSSQQIIERFPLDHFPAASPRR